MSMALEQDNFSQGDFKMSDTDKGEVSNSTIRVAVTQHEPVWLNLDGTVEKTCTIIAEAAAAGAKLVAFPELWIPGYPVY